MRALHGQDTWLILSVPSAPRYQSAPMHAALSHNAPTAQATTIALDLILPFAARSQRKVLVHSRQLQ